MRFLLLIVMVITQAACVCISGRDGDSATPAEEFHLVPGPMGPVPASERLAFDPPPADFDSGRNDDPRVIAERAFLVPSAYEPGQLVDAEVIRFSDGDTFTARVDGREVRIRFWFIDTPESAYPGRWPEQPFSQDAAEFTQAFIDGRAVMLRMKGELTYGREVAEVIVDGYSLNRELVRNGLAWWYNRYVPEDSDLMRLQEEAAAEQRGLWSDENAMPPWQWRRHDHN